MSTSLVLACLWVVTASVIALFPSRRQHWPAAYVLIAIGIPLLGYITYQNGPLVGLLCLVAGASVLRWPVLYLFRWLRNELLPGSLRGSEAGHEAGHEAVQAHAEATQPSAGAEETGLR